MEDMKYMLEKLEDLVNIPSPSGYTELAVEYVKNEADRLGFPTEYLNKGGLVITIPGVEKSSLGLSAHVDTLGAMVRSVTDHGMLKLVSIGGFTMESIEGSYVKIHTRTGKCYEGTILSTSPSVHVYDDAKTLERIEKNMEVRIDEPVKDKSDVEKLGISSGDFVSFDPYFRSFENGYIKTRHLDDKAAVAILMTLMKYIKEEQKIPVSTIKLLISNYEEIGHGAAYVPKDLTEMISVDMGSIGEDLNGSEQKVSICAKDSAGPYDYNMTTKLITLAKKHQLDFAVDIFPHYSSDVSAALRGGNNIRGALIGPGVHASHGLERTHKKALENTLMLLKAYIGVL